MLWSIASLLFALADPNGRLLVSCESEFPFDDELRLDFGEKNGGEL